VTAERRQEADAGGSQAGVVNDPDVARHPDDVAGKDLIGAHVGVPRGQLTRKGIRAPAAAAASVGKVIEPPAERIKG
jgi:hypothetical protein